MIFFKSRYIKNKTNKTIVTSSRMRADVTSVCDKHESHDTQCQVIGSDQCIWKESAVSRIVCEESLQEIVEWAKKHGPKWHEEELQGRRGGEWRSGDVRCLWKCDTLQCYDDIRPTIRWTNTATCSIPILQESVLSCSPDVSDLYSL